jgi:hypothetical protein
VAYSVPPNRGKQEPYAVKVACGCDSGGAGTEVGSAVSSGLANQDKTLCISTTFDKIYIAFAKGPGIARILRAAFETSRIVVDDRCLSLPRGLVGLLNLYSARYMQLQMLVTSSSISGAHQTSSISKQPWPRYSRLLFPRHRRWT